MLHPRSPLGQRQREVVIPQVNFIGQLLGATGFPEGCRNVWCKFIIESGESWERVIGETEGTTQTATPSNDDPLAVWAHPIDVMYRTTGIFDWPKMRIEVWQADSFNRQQFAGYTVCALPQEPGFYRLDSSVWRPKAESINVHYGYYLGAHPQVVAPEIVSSGDSQLRQRLRTTSMGLVHIEIQVIGRYLEELKWERREILSGLVTPPTPMTPLPGSPMHDAKAFGASLMPGTPLPQDGGITPLLPSAQKFATRMAASRTRPSLASFKQQQSVDDSMRRSTNSAAPSPQTTPQSTPQATARELPPLNDVRSTPMMRSLLDPIQSESPTIERRNLDSISQLEPRSIPNPTASFDRRPTPLAALGRRRPRLSDLAASTATPARDSTDSGAPLLQEGAQDSGAGVGDS